MIVENTRIDSATPAAKPPSGTEPLPPAPTGGSYSKVDYGHVAPGADAIRRGFQLNNNGATNWNITKVDFETPWPAMWKADLSQIGKSFPPDKQYQFFVTFTPPAK